MQFFILIYPKIRSEYSYIKGVTAWTSLSEMLSSIIVISFPLMLKYYTASLKKGVKIPKG